jgi:hypothetical protein
MTPDPGHVGASLGDPQSWNAYAYSRNDPINGTDPTGMTFDFCVDGKGCYTSTDADFQEYVVFGSSQGISVTGDPASLAARGWILEYGLKIGDYFHRDIDGGPYMGLGDFLLPWLEGNLPSTIDYGPYHQATQDMARSTAVLKDRQEYIDKGCPATGRLAADNFEAYAETFGPVAPGVPVLRSLPGFVFNPTQAQVGGFGGRTSHITRNSNGTVTYTITNTAGVSSLLGLSAAGGVLSKVGININRNAWDNPFGANGQANNVVQTFRWSEPDPCR